MAEGWLVCTMQQLTTVRRNAWAMWKKWGGGKGGRRGRNPHETSVQDIDG